MSCPEDSTSEHSSHSLVLSYDLSACFAPSPEPWNQALLVYLYERLGYLLNARL